MHVTYSAHFILPGSYHPVKKQYWTADKGFM